jgi:uncharacterized protein involved in exopolysaccharide biosynthesis
MDIWTTLIIEQYANLVSREAQYILSYYKQKVEQIEAELRENEKDLARLRWEMPNKIKELSDLENLLAPAAVSYDFRGTQRDLRRFTAARTDVAIAVSELAELPKEGLMTRLAKVQIDIAKQEEPAKQYGDALKGDAELSRFLKDASEATLLGLLSGKIPEKQMADLLASRDGQPVLATLKPALEERLRSELRGLEEKRAEENALKQHIAETQQGIARLQTEVAALQQQYEARQREVEALNEKHRLARDWEAQVEIEADATNFAQGNKIEGVDLKILAHAAQPDLRTYPKKALMTLIVGAIGFLISCLLVILNRFIKDAAKATVSPV